MDTIDCFCSQCLGLELESYVLMNQTIEPTSIVGYRFDPSDQELIWYLCNKVNGHELLNNPVVDLNIYQIDPSFIQFDDQKFLPGERFFYVERETLSRNENGKRPRRTLTSENVAVGYWHANTGDKEITDEYNNLIGYKKSLTFFQYEDSNNKERKKAKKGDWIMHEYRLPTDKFEKWVLCRIKKSPRSKKEEF